MREHSIQPGEPEAGLPVKVLEMQDPAEHRTKLHDLIERCAYELYEAHGAEDGHATEDWRHAELKVLCSETQCPVGFIELEDNVEVDAAVEDFEPQDLEVSVDHRCVIITGDRKATTPGEPGVHLAGEPHPIFGVLSLPVEVDPSRATATLKSGMLHVALPKARKMETVRNEQTAA